MPAVGAGDFRQLPPAPKAPPPPASTTTGNNPRGVAIVQPKPQPVPKALSTGANPRGTAIVQPSHGVTVNDVQAVHPDPKATISVFRAQPPAQQKMVVQGAIGHPTLPASKIILDYVKQANGGAIPQLPGLAAIKGPSVTGGIVNATAGLPHGLLGIARNAAKDAWNLPGGTVEGLAGMVKENAQGLGDLASGNVKGGLAHEGTAAGMFVDPYVQLAEHPLKTFEAHPLNTALMFSGAESLLGRGAGFAARAGLAGDAAKAAASTVREPLSVGTIAGEPSPITESRAYSPDVFKKGVQVAGEKLTKAKGRNPNVAAESKLPEAVAYSMNKGIRAKLYRGADEMTATHQAVHRAERTNAIQALQKERPSEAARNVVSFVNQKIIRTPETAVEDATHEINRLKAAQAALPRRSLDQYWNRRQIADLSKAVKTPGALDEAFKADKQITPFVNSQDKALGEHGMLDPDQMERSKLMPYALAHMGAKYDPGMAAQFEEDKAIMPGLKNADGSKLSTADIKAHMKENGVDEPSFVEHSMNKVGLGRFYKRYQLARGTLNGGVRTGKAFEKGAYDHTWNALIGQVADRAQTLARASLHDRVISRYGVQIPDAVRSRLKIPTGVHDLTPEEGRTIARAARVDDHGNPIPGALELTPVQRSAIGQLDKVRNLQTPRELSSVSQVELKALKDSIEQTARRSDNHRNVVLVPTDLVNRFGQQYARTDGLLRSVGKVTQQFRRTVLPYSTHWMTQIASEAGLRAILGGALHPGYLADGRALTHYLEDTPEGRAVNAETTQSTFYSGGGSSIREAAAGRSGRGVLDVNNPNAGRIASAAKTFPPSRLLIAAHNRYADTVTAAMYGLEHNARLMGLGKLAHKEVQSFGFKWSNAVRIQGHAIADLGEKLKDDPALTARFGREIDDLFGKYSKFTPKQRAMIQSFTPFLPWYLNAAKYVLYHLPAHHPVASAVLASLRQTINQDVADGKKLPLNVWAMQELARISPFGIFTPPSTKPSTGAALAGQQFTGAFLPQAEGSLYDLAGVNPFGSGPLKTAPTLGAAYGSPGYSGDVKAQSGPAAAAAAENLIESIVPLARYLRLAEAKGEPTEGTSTLLSPQVKPGGKKGNLASTLERILNPMYSVQSAQGSASAPAYGAPATTTSGGSGWGGGTSSSSSSGWGGGSSASTGGWGG